MYTWDVKYLLLCLLLSCLYLATMCIIHVFMLLDRSIERAAQHEAKRTEQKAKGELERQKLMNEKDVEEARRTLLELQAVAAAVESSGQAKAEAQAQAEKLLIEGHSAIECE